MRINSKEIAIPDGEIGEQAGSDQAEARLVEARIGALARIAPHRLGEGDALFGMPAMGILAVERFAIDRGVEPGEGVDGRHRPVGPHADMRRSEEHTSELQSLMRNSYAVSCLKKKRNNAQQK